MQQAKKAESKQKKAEMINKPRTRALPFLFSNL